MFVSILYHHIKASMVSLSISHIKRVLIHKTLPLNHDPAFKHVKDIGIRNNYKIDLREKSWNGNITVYNSYYFCNICNLELISFWKWNNSNSRWLINFTSCYFGSHGTLKILVRWFSKQLYSTKCWRQLSPETRPC